MIETYLYPAIFTAVLIPFFAPLLMDLLACAFIAIRNRIVGTPTWVVGTNFRDIILQSGASLGPCYIHAKTWKFIVLKQNRGRAGNPGVVRMKKRDMMKTVTIELNQFIRK